MKLLLTSSGLSTPSLQEAFLSLLPKPAPECSAIVLSDIQTEQQFVYSFAAKKELTDLGLRDVIVFNINDESFTLTDHVDVVYVCGGNTFHILDRMKKSGVFNFIKQESEKNIVYVGVSAGSIIAGPNIEIAGHGSAGDPNDINLADLKSLQLTDITILPHFKPSLRSEADEFQKKTKYQVQTLRDDEALMITNSTQKLIV